MADQPTDMKTDAQALSSSEALAALAWLIDMGADEALEPAPLNRFELAPARAERAPVQAGQAAQANRAKEAGNHSAHGIGTSSTGGPKRVTPRAPAAAAGAGAMAAQAAAAGAHSLADLKKAMETFDGGHIKRAAKHTIFAEGPQTANVMFVGEAPAAEDDRLGAPFRDQDGQLLDKMLAAIGLDRTQNAYLTTLVPWRPLGAKTADSALVTQCLPFLRKHIALMRPKFVVCLGTIPARALFGVEDGAISRMRGKWRDLDIEGHKVAALATYPPSHLIRQPRFKGDAWRDLLALKSRLASEAEEAAPNTP